MSFKLSSNVYVPQARDSTNTIIEDIPQESFDDLYDISEGEEEGLDIPITFAESQIRSRTDKIRESSTWPSTQKTPQPVFDRGMLSPPIATPQAELSRIAKRSSVYSAYSVDAPSLDDSYTSEDMSGLSCPSTPDTESKRNNVDEDWSIPAQLNPTSLLTLDYLSINETPVSDAPAPQMTEVGDSLPNLHTNLKVNTGFESGELSALSIPSPGGFFSQLEPGARSTWLPTPQKDVPPTAVAEKFYIGSFDSQKSAPVEIIVEDTSDTEGPPTARQIPPQWALAPVSNNPIKSPNYFAELLEYHDNYEKENYQEQIEQQITANLDRTASWLESQDVSFEEEELSSSDETVTAPELEAPINDSEKDDIFYQGFTHIQTSKKENDAFVHRKARTEKLRLDRKCLFTSHVNQLESQYKVPPPPPKTLQLITACRLIDGVSTIVQEDDSEKIVIANAQREQKALEQIEPVSWNVEATKFLNGGTLLTSPVTKTFKRPFDDPKKPSEGRILDLGGAASCDWSWQVAMEYPHVTVHTVCTADGPKVDRKIAAPKNHKCHVVPNLWTLPFPSNYFDCISARTIHSLLRTQKIPRFGGVDEYDLCMRECLRVLKPGGYLEFALLDAELLNAGRKGQALSAEFCSNLRSRGYDIAPTKSWLPRLRKAGFGHTRRAWLVLPMSQFIQTEGNSTAEASHITGMVGAWAWERWMVKLQREMGRDESALLDGVTAAMEEGAKTGAAWRYLSGWAQKPF